MPYSIAYLRTLLNTLDATPGHTMPPERVAKFRAAVEDLERRAAAAPQAASSSEAAALPAPPREPPVYERDALQRVARRLEQDKTHAANLERWAAAVAAAGPEERQRPAPPPQATTDRADRVALLEQRAAADQGLFSRGDAVAVTSPWEAQSTHGRRSGCAAPPQGQPSAPAAGPDCARSRHAYHAPGAARSTPAPTPSPGGASMASIKQLESAEEKKAQRKAQAEEKVVAARAALDQAKAEHVEAKQALAEGRKAAKTGAGNGAKKRTPRPAKEAAAAPAPAPVAEEDADGDEDQSEE